MLNQSEWRTGLISNSSNKICTNNLVRYNFYNSILSHNLLKWFQYSNFTISFIIITFCRLLHFHCNHQCNRILRNHLYHQFYKEFLALDHKVLLHRDFTSKYDLQKISSCRLPINFNNKKLLFLNHLLHCRKHQNLWIDLTTWHQKKA